MAVVFHSFDMIYILILPFENGLSDVNFPHISVFFCNSTYYQIQFEVIFISNRFVFSSGIVSSEAFDITLMMVFFRRLPNLQIGKKLPLATDESTAADLTRIVYFRNKRAHCNSIDDKEFAEEYNVISKV